MTRVKVSPRPVATPRRASSSPERCVTRIVVLVARNSVRLHRRRRCVGLRRMRVVIWRRCVRGIRRRARRMLRCRMVCARFLSPFLVRSSLMFVLRTGKSCGGNGLACASGVCTSLDSTWNIYTRGSMIDFYCLIRAMPDCGCFDELAESMS